MRRLMRFLSQIHPWTWHCCHYPSCYVFLQWSWSSWSLRVTITSNHHLGCVDSMHTFHFHKFDFHCMIFFPKASELLKLFCVCLSRYIYQRWDINWNGLGGSLRITSLSDAEWRHFPSTSSLAPVIFIGFLQASGSGSLELSMKSPLEHFSFSLELCTMVVEVQQSTNSAKVSRCIKSI